LPNPNQTDSNNTITQKRQVSLGVYEKAEELSFESAPTDETISCPALQRTKNVEFDCLTPDGRYNHCEPPLPPYTVAHLKCAKYYKSAGDLAYRYRKCKVRE
jgi:hypothetical protein